MRLFIGIELPTDVRDAIVSSGTSVLGRWTEKGRARVVPRENLHITMKFIGDLSDPQLPVLCEALKEAAPRVHPKLAADRMECLPERGPIHIIAASINGELDQLHAVYESLESACEVSGIPCDRRPFKPHITFARLRMPLPTRERVRIESTPLRPEATRWFEAREVILFESHLERQGARYVPLARFPLA
jgi:2'-5' RNA ligase